MIQPTLSPRRSIRGGARNSASRESFVLTAAQISNIHTAADHAVCINLPLTRMISIHWQKIGVPREAMVKATGRFLDIATKALARRGIRTSWIYVHENDVSDGWHCHILMHVPKEAVDYIIRNQIRWIKSITGRSYESKVINSRIIGGRLGIERTCRAVYLINLAGTLDYVVKQTSDDTVARFQLPQQSCPGLIIGKRTGTSQNIAVTARRRHQAASR